jgi:hypothetical protein
VQKLQHLYRFNCLPETSSIRAFFGILYGVKVVVAVLDMILYSFYDDNDIFFTIRLAVLARQNFKDGFCTLLEILNKQNIFFVDRGLCKKYK